MMHIWFTTMQFTTIVRPCLREKSQRGVRN